MAQSIPTAPMPAEASSARIEGPDTFAGYKANQPGDCQWVMPGITTSSRSARRASNGSGSSGTACGSLASMSPGATPEGIGSSPTRSM